MLFSISCSKCTSACAIRSIILLTVGEWKKGSFADFNSFAVSPIMPNVKINNTENPMRAVFLKTDIETGKIDNATRITRMIAVAPYITWIEFESDFGRVIFSPAIRRMHDKTQVIPLTTDDNIHTRLTHSLEVMAVGYSLGLKLSTEENFLKENNLEKNKVLREIPVILKSLCSTN